VSPPAGSTEQRRFPGHARNAWLGASPRRCCGLTTRGVRAGSGRGKAAPRRLERAERSSAGLRKSTCPWPVNPRLAYRTRETSGFGQTRNARRSCPSLATSSETGTRASVCKERWMGERRESGGPAVVLAGCVGCRSRRAALGPRSQDLGSSSMAHVPRGMRAHRANRRRKPDRGGESRQAREQRDRWRVPRDPTRRRESVRCDRGREHSYDGRRPGPRERRL